MKTEKYNVLVLKSNYLKAFQFLLFKLSQTKNKHQVSNRTFRIMFFFFFISENDRYRNKILEDYVELFNLYKKLFAG